LFIPLYAVLAAALVFYFLLPEAAALSRRLSWRRFRRRLEALSRAPLLRYRDAVPSRALPGGQAGAAGPSGAAPGGAAAARGEGGAGDGGRGEARGPFRLYGRIEAMEGDDRVWLRGKEVSALVDLSRSPLYVLSPGPEEEAGAGSGERLERISWRRVRVLSEGTRLMAAGPLRFEGGRPVFAEAPGEPLVAVIHGGGEGDLLSRLVAGARRPALAGGPFATVSVAFGLALSSALLFLLAEGRGVLPTVRVLAYLAALSPLLPFLPPGLALYFLHRRLAREAQGLRVARDLLRLPLRFFGSPDLAEARLACGSPYRRSLGGPASGPPPPGYSPVALPLKPGAGASWTLFGPEEGCEDPAAERVAVPGEPELLAERCAGKARRLGLGAVLALAAGGALNFGLVFAVWRSLP